MENNSKEKKQKFLLQTFAIVAALITPYAYLIGVTYNQGYMDAFGVSTDFAPKSVADVYVDAYFAFGAILIDVMKVLSNDMTLLNWLGVFLEVFAITLIYVNLDSSLKSVRSKLENIECPKLESFLSKLHPEKNSTSKAIIYSVILSYLLSFLVSFLLVILIFWWGLPLLALNKGKASAEGQVKAYLKEQCFLDQKTRWNNCVKIINKDNKTRYEGILVAKNGNEIAIFNKNGSTILKLDNQDLIVKARK